MVLARGSSSGTDDRRLAWSPAIRLSLLTFSVAAVTGVAMAATHISAPLQLLQTAYGQTLAGKQLLVVAAVALGAIAWRTGWRRAELGALTLLLGVAGLLVALPPPR
jgi:putative copper export protein